MVSPYFGTIEGIVFSPLGDEDLTAIAAVTITHPDTFTNEKIPRQGGVADAKLGAIDYNYNCGTCQNNKNLCPGHTGKIDLNQPTISPVAIPTVIKYLRIICHQCYELIDQNVSLNKTTTGTRICKNCGFENPRIIGNDSSIIKMMYGTTQKEVWPQQYRHILEGIPDSVLAKLRVMPIAHPRKFVLSKLAVSSISTRPDVKQIGGNRSSNDHQTVFYHFIVQNNMKLLPQFPEENKDDKLNKGSKLLWYIIDSCIKESNKSELSLSFKTPMMNDKESSERASLLKKFSGKSGEIRYNMLSKTAFDVSRTVIVGDPTIPIDSLSIPLEAAKTIQIKEKVRPYNIELMQMYLQNAFNGTYPACNVIIKGSSGKEFAVKQNRDKIQLEIGDTIKRDIVTGDWALFNRAPTLFYVSTMRHNIIVSQDPNSKTFRMNETACKPYAADFDGDEMNLVFSANMVSMADSMVMSGMPRFFIGYQHCVPHIENIKDATLGLFMLTRSKAKLTKYQAMKLFANTTMKPSFNDGKEIYTGRELVSMILPSINYIGSNNFYDEKLAPYIKYEEDEKKIIIKHGKLLSGVLDKKISNIYQIIAIEYSSRQAMTTMFNMQQIALAYLTIKGFTVGIKDLLLDPKSEDEIKHITQSIIEESNLVTDRLLQNNIIPPLGQTVQDYYESEQIAILNHDYVEPMMRGINQDNSILMLSLCGSTGNLTIIKQIHASYGQRTIGPKRLPQIMSYKRTNPFFPRFATSPESRGFIGTALKHGVKPTEFIAGTQESRVAIINKTMLTAVTGAQSRINVKNLENIFITNIGVCETSEFIVEQAFGDTGIDPRLLEPVKFPTVLLSNADFEKKYNVNKEEFAQLTIDRNEFRRIFLTLEQIQANVKFNDVQLLPVNTNRIYEDVLFDIFDAPTDTDKIESVTQSEEELKDMRSMVKEFCDTIYYVFYNDTWKAKRGYVAPAFKSALFLTCINIRSILFTSNLMKITKVLLNGILHRIKSKLIESIFEYGTGIGVITAMSVSEPSTQLTLHSIRADVRARISKKSPIQSFKEIVGVVSLEKAQDPTMTMKLQEGVTLDRAREIANFIEMLKLNDFVKEWQVFYEKYGLPVHPQFKHEQKIITEFERIIINAPPSDLIHWCIRFELDMYNLILKNMTLDQIILSLYKNYSDIHIVYTSDNDSTAIVLRIYIRSIAGIGTLKEVHDLGENLLNSVVRGVQGVVSAYVDNNTSTNKIKEDGTISPVNIYSIKTNGVNIMGIFCLQYKFPEIDYTTLQTDNIMETVEMFGISAARSKIISEMSTVLGGLYYGHYNLIASLMTIQGKCSSISNSGPEKRGANSLLRLAHHKPIRVLEKMLTHGEKVMIDGISPHLIVGSIPHIGSFYNQIGVNIKFVQERTKTVESILDEF
jgi:DNA-directed RNA polymerase II subunit RPB1